MLAQRPIPRVLSRPNLLLGGEREPVLMCALLCGGTAIQSGSLTIIGACIVLWIAALVAWRWIAKVDPYMTKVYRRSLLYRGYYPPFARPYRSR